ncbi:MAG: triple tyrosine motif-containing protein [Bacteroidota bacterium]|nr:triple tyrosine motif-containing protein [Bacteroidota bacterium]
MNRTIAIVFAIIFLCGVNSLFGQNENNSPKRRCPVRTINFENGLLNNGTTHIITDKLGFTWISTKTGMQRYDGYSLQTILPVVGKDTFAVSSPVYFFELKDGTIWISFRQYVLQYDPATNLFSVAIALPSAGEYSFSIIPLKETPAGIWCIQEKKGIVIYSRKGKLLKQFSFFEPSVLDAIIQSQEFLYTYKIASNDQYVFISKNENDNCYASGYKTRANILVINTERNESGEIGLADSNILGLACNRDKLFVLSIGKLFCINIGDKRVKEIDIGKIVNENFAAGSLRASGYNLLLLSINNHLFEFDTAGTYRTELTDLDRDPVAATGFIQHVYRDRFRRIWILTNDDIKRIEDREAPFTHFIYPGEKNNFVRSICYDKEKNILIAGCFYSGIQVYDTLANPLWKKPLVFPDTKNILAIEKLTTDEYLVVTFGRGWYLLNLASQTIKPFAIPPGMDALMQSRTVNFSNNLQRLNKNTLLVATAINVFRCEISGTHLLSVIPLLPDQKIYRNTVNCFLYDSGNSLWAGTSTGDIYHLEQNKSLQTFSLPGGYGPRSMAEDANHNVWVGTDKGIYVFSKTGTLLKTIMRENGLRNDCIYAILPADSGAAVFASSNLGISHVSLEGVVKNYSKEMGLQENEFNTASACKTPGGKYYFGGVNGITAFYPSSLSVINDTPFLYITHLIINDKVYNSSSGTWNGDSILLNYKQNHFRFDLAAIGLLNSNEYVYQYRMSGFEKSWQTSYQPTGINYTLQPGNYTLEIRCSPMLSPGSTFYKNFFIRINPPWWQTWWFRFLAVVILISAIILLVHQYNRGRYLQKIRELQTTQRIQLERERISRDLHDNLGAYVSAIASDIDHINPATMTGNSFFENLKENASEIMSNLRNTIWALNKENITVTGISDRFKNYIQKMQPAYPDKKMFVHEDITTNHSLSPAVALNIFRIMQEAVHNALKHSGGNNISINISSHEYLQVCIADNGRGFLIPGERNKGNGLQNMQSRSEEANLFFMIENNDPSGTKVIIASHDV